MSEAGRHSEVGVFLLGEAVQGPLTYNIEVAPVQGLEAAAIEPASVCLRPSDWSRHSLRKTVSLLWVCFPTPQEHTLVAGSFSVFLACHLGFFPDLPASSLVPLGVLK